MKYTSYTGGLIVVDADSFELEVGVAVVRASWVNAVLVGDYLPELSYTHTTPTHTSLIVNSRIKPNRNS